MKTIDDSHKILTGDQLSQLLDIASAQREGGHIRNGQSLMNALHTVDPELYKEITGTDADCFYDDSKVTNFFIRIS